MEQWNLWNTSVNLSSYPFFEIYRVHESVVVPTPIGFFKPLTVYKAVKTLYTRTDLFNTTGLPTKEYFKYFSCELPTNLPLTNTMDRLYLFDDIPFPKLIIEVTANNCVLFFHEVLDRLSDFYSHIYTFPPGEYTQLPSFEKPQSKLKKVLYGKHESVVIDTDEGVIVKFTPEQSSPQKIRKAVKDTLLKSKYVQWADFVGISLKNCMLE